MQADVHWTHRITQGTRAVVVSREPVLIRITDPKKGTELHVGETQELSAGDFGMFWESISPASRLV